MGNLDRILSNVHTVHYCMIRADVRSSVVTRNRVIACLYSTRQRVIGEVVLSINRLV